MTKVSGKSHAIEKFLKMTVTFCHQAATAPSPAPPAPPHSTAVPAVISEFALQRGERRTHSIPSSAVRLRLFRCRSLPESPAAVLAVAGERRMNPVIGRQIAGTDPPSGVVNVQHIERSALTPGAVLESAPVAGKVAAHMPDADCAVVHGERHAYSCVTLSLHGRTRILPRGREDINETTLLHVDFGDAGLRLGSAPICSSISNARLSGQSLPFSASG